MESTRFFGYATGKLVVIGLILICESSREKVVQRHIPQAYRSPTILEVETGGELIRLCILYDTKGWAYYHRASALKKYAPSDFDVTITSIKNRDVWLTQPAFDIFFCIPYGTPGKIRAKIQEYSSRSLLVVSFNTGWPRRRRHFQLCINHADALIVNNQEYWEKSGRISGTYPISNGVDRQVFSMQVPLDRRPPAVLWCGKPRIHGDLKGYQRIITPLRRRLEIQGIPMHIQAAKRTSPHCKSPAEMADWYNQGTIYVVASRLEGTPNPALEAASCGCTLVSTRVGNMPELILDHVNGYLVDRRVDCFFQAILEARDNYMSLAAHMQESIQAWDWAIRAKEFFSLFRSLLNGQAPLLKSR